MKSWWQRLVRHRQLDRQLEAELGDHRERLVEDYVRAGMSAAAARRRVTIELGGLEGAKELCRDARGTRWAEEFVSDLRYAVRTLRRRPGFTAASLLLLALGVGANTAIFSLVEAVVLRRLPVAAPDRLQFIAHGHGTRQHSTSNYPFLERVRQHTDVFDGITAYTTATFRVSDGEDVDRVPGEYAAGNYHGVLGAPFVLGRGFVNEDDRSAGQSPAVVIGDRYWARRFNRRSDILGHTIVVDGRSLTIVGVTAAGFDGLTPGRPSEITLPLSLKAAQNPAYLTMHDTWTSLPLVARLKPGVTTAAASTIVDGVFRQYLSEPENAWYKADGAVLLPAGQGSAELRVQYSTALGVLMAIVAVVFLIAAANLANLQLARAAARAKEMSIRLSIGAGTGRLVRQLVTESLVLALTGGGLGLLLAWWGTAAIANQFRAGQNPVVLNVEVNATVLIFTMALSLVMGLLFGVIPAMRATRVELVSGLKGMRGYGQPSRRRWSLRQMLVAGQIALCVVLVTGAGLLLRTLTNLVAPDGSFTGAGVVLFALEARDRDLPDDFWPATCAALLDRLHSRREVESASCSTSTPNDMTESRRGAVAGSTPIADGVLANVVSPDFFRTFGVPLIKGRALTAQDSSSAQKVAVINERMALVGFGGLDPIGRTFNFRATPKEQIAVVGVVRDVRHNPRAPASPTVYTPLGQGGEIEDGMTMAVQSPLNTAAVAEVVRSERGPSIAALTVGRPRTLDAQIGGLVVRERTLALLSGWFGVLAVLLSCIGLYGVLSYDVARRRRDIGIRLALGADSSRVLRGLIREAASLTATGIVLGTLAALVVTTVLAELLYGVSPRDPLTIAAAAGLLALTALLAAYLPARRAARTDPALVLRSE